MSSLVKKESFSFAIKDYYIEHQGTAILDVDITLDFKKPKADANQRITTSSSRSSTTSTTIWSTIRMRQLQILNTNLAKSLITDKIPAWDTTYNLAKSVAELTVDIEVQADSGGAAYTRSAV